MPLIDKKILESERNAVYVKSNDGDRLVGTTEENKNVFDKYPELIRAKYNELIDLLISMGFDSVADDLAERYTKDETNNLVEVETKSLVADIGINLTTGAITITKKDGTATVIDTALEKVPATFTFVEDTASDKFYLQVTNVDGTISQTEVTNLMNQYTFQTGDTIAFTVNKSGTTTTVQAEIVAKSITLAMLADEVTKFLSDSVASVAADRTVVESARTEVLDASTTVTNNAALTVTARDTAVEYGNLSQSYAVGGTGTRTDEDSDNSSYYARQAALYARQAEGYKNEAAEIVGGNFATNEALADSQLYELAVEGASDDGIAYTATLPGVTELTPGLTFLLRPLRTSESGSNITLNVNGLGDVQICRRYSSGNTQTIFPINSMQLNNAYRLTYSCRIPATLSTGVWVLSELPKCMVADIAGVLPIANGGTGGTTKEQALAYLGALPVAGGVMTGGITWRKANDDGSLVVCGLADNGYRVQKTAEDGTVLSDVMVCDEGIKSLTDVLVLLSKTIFFADNEDNVSPIRLTNVADPVEAQDAATKNYVDNKITYGTEDLEAGVTELETGAMHLVYEA